MEILKEIWLFLRESKKLWMAPIFFLMILIGAITIVAEGSAIAPLIYAIF